MDINEALLEDISLLVSDLIVNYRGQIDAVREKYWTDLMVVTEAKTKAYIFRYKLKLIKLTEMKSVMSRFHLQMTALS